jgi:hypothetical protein
VYVPDIDASVEFAVPVTLTVCVPSTTENDTLVPLIEPVKAAVVAHGSPLKVTVPVTLLLVCCNDVVPIAVVPNGVDVNVNCQFPVRLGPELELLLLPQPARQPHSNRTPSILLTTFPPK